MDGRLKRHIKSKSVVNIVLSIIVVAVMIRKIFMGDFMSVFMCVLTLLLFNIPMLVEKYLHVDLPIVLESIILFFIFASTICGEIASFYTKISWWDTMLHTSNGFLMAAIGFAMIDIINRSPRFHISLSPMFVAFVAFCFSMTVGVLWEFFEFAMDYWFLQDMQNDRFVDVISSVSLNEQGLNDAVLLKGIEKTTLHLADGSTYVIENGYMDIGIIDTMKDLFVNLIGAVVFSIIGYFYIIGRNKGTFAKKFIPQLQSKEEKEKTKA
ncbi:MAG: hypothetical protein Q4A12_02750 [Eubacteriales bacterium]|nr:hypothetical protein [Eubacteriales bacterium]